MSDTQVLFKDMRLHINKLHQYFPESMHSFIDTYNYLCKHTEIISGQYMLPNFMDWDLLNDQDLCSLIDQIPILPEKILPTTQLEDNGQPLLFIPFNDKYFISRELPYTNTEVYIDDCFVLTYVYQGSCTVVIDGRRHDMNAGELCLLSPRVPRSRSLTETDVILSIFIEKDTFNKTFLKMLQGNHNLTEFFQRTLLHSEKGHAFFMLPLNTESKQVFQHMFQETVHTDHYSQNMFLNYLEILFTLIIRSHGDTYTYYSQKPASKAIIMLPHILQYISDHYKTVSLQALADTFHYERSYLSKLIHQNTGKTFSTILNEIKINHAIDYLTHTELGFSIISEMVGYNSADHFSRVFKQYMGMSPREYHKKH